MRAAYHLSAFQRLLLVVLRVAIGWHFLYEGLSKLLTPGWSAGSYLAASRGFLSAFFNWMAATPPVLCVVDLANMWGLAVIGLCLMLGLFSCAASLAGALLIVLYYLAYPPLPWLDFGAVREGSYLIVDKNLVELAALCALSLIPTGTYLGMDRLIAVWRRKQASQKSAEQAAVASDSSEVAAQDLSLERRALVKGLATTPLLVAFGAAVAHERAWESHEEKHLVDGISSATIKTFHFATLKELKGQVPSGRIGNLLLSRMMLGGNLMGGWAHSRDLLYVSKLVKAYHTRDKIFETFLLAEKCGINTIITNPVLCNVINEYWKRDIGKIQFISDCGGTNILEGVRISIDRGAAACYFHGGAADALVQEGKFDVIAKALELIRQNRLPAGIGAHYLRTVQECVEQGLIPDFWMKTLHRTDYWSAQFPTEHDNIFCREPQETVAFMKDRKEPWIAFKTLAAGAISPETGFRFAYENGADFICVGMYDFQLVEDTNIVLGILSGNVNRLRPWMA